MVVSPFRHRSKILNFTMHLFLKAAGSRFLEVTGNRATSEKNRFLKTTGNIAISIEASAEAAGSVATSTNTFLEATQFRGHYIDGDLNQVPHPHFADPTVSHPKISILGYE